MTGLRYHGRIGSGGRRSRGAQTRARLVNHDGPSRLSVADPVLVPLVSVVGSYLVTPRSRCPDRGYPPFFMGYPMLVLTVAALLLLAALAVAACEAARVLIARQLAAPGLHPAAVAGTSRPGPPSAPADTGKDRP